MSRAAYGTSETANEFAEALQRAGIDEVVCFVQMGTWRRTYASKPWSIGKTMCSQDSRAASTTLRSAAHMCPETPRHASLRPIVSPRLECIQRFERADRRAKSLEAVCRAKDRVMTRSAGVPGPHHQVLCHART
jgi:hypothetical protein